jgi:SAM-dependent methyltransferase
MQYTQTTRGFGLLEVFLSRQRALVANRHIPQNLRSGRILDIGCGTYPLFLVNSEFKEKYGIDKVDLKHISNDFGTNLINLDIEEMDALPFSDEFFDVVTMLAVFEHLSPDRIANVLNEIHRVLRKNGICIITIPAGWTDRLLRILAKLKLISSDEINEHKDTYNFSKIDFLFKNSNFKFGHFEMFMNMYFSIVK